MGYVFILYTFYLGWRICRWFEVKSDFSYLRIVAAPSVDVFKRRWGFLLSIALALVITAPVFFDALYLSDGSLIMKGYMWSDMTLHLGLIASFAKGEYILPDFIAYHL